MTTVQIIYSRSHTIGGLLIRAASWWAQWCHCGIITPEGTVIEALAFKGVVETPIDAFLNRVSAYEIVSLQVPDAAAAIASARSRVGRGYDYGAIAQFILRENLESKTRFHCVEHVELALQDGGATRFRIAAVKLTPQQSYINSASMSVVT